MIVILLACITIVIYSTYSLFGIYQKYEVSAKTYRVIEDIYNDAQADSSRTEEMKGINNDYVGWITIKDTKVNYPVVKTKNNSFYLSHNFYKEEDFVGTIFMDSENVIDSLDKNIILYGHNMKDHSMFGSLKKYLDQDYFQKHKTVQLDILDKTYEWEIFAAYTSHEIDWMQTKFDDENDFENYLSDIHKKSNVSEQIAIDNEDNILTLSTCTVNSNETERFIVHAKLIRIKGE